MSVHAPDFKQALGQIVRTSRADGRGRVFAVCAGEDKQGTSYCARGLSLAAAHLGFECLLVDMDITQNTQFEAVTSPDVIRDFGQMNGPYDASLGQDPFWRVSPSAMTDNGQRESDAAFAALHMLGHGQLSVTRFLWDKIKPGQTVHIAQARPYWHAARDKYALTFIDIPSTARSQAGGTVFGEADGTVLVATDSRSASAKDMLAKVNAAGGTCVGIILNSAVERQPSGTPGAFG